MSEISQLSFTLRDVTVALLREQNIKEGVWVLGVEMSIVVGNMGPEPQSALPTAMLQIPKFTLVRHEGEEAAVGFAVNAATIA
ncbi:hypothetical protein [Prosthecomicrobium sp. N25]|uniref:hypothetical protein n=1 Tax=Prosthecomicrobium sp. N25 TaxID=3129254 RepID=UPI00307813EB